ncbi:MAG: DUF3341 domain-containing protein [Polyangiaceae bacterium]
MKKAVMCVVHSHEQAESLVNQLQTAGFPGDSISVLFPKRDASEQFAADYSTKAPEGALAGAGAGALAGGALGLLAGIGALVIPGLGPFIAAGPLFAAMSGAAAGLTMGGVMGALVGMGIPEEEAKRYEEHLRGGRILVSVHSDSLQEQKRAEYIFRASRVEDVCTTIDTSMQKKRELRSHP